MNAETLIKAVEEARDLAAQKNGPEISAGKYKRDILSILIKDVERTAESQLSHEDYRMSFNL